VDRLDALRLFTRVVESGSFSAVAREAGIGQSAVSKQVAALEGRLGVQLLRRTSRSMTLTDAGQVLYESTLRLVEEFDALETLVSRGQSAPSGLIRVTVAPVFGRLYIVPRLPAFFARNPDISVELTGSERMVNLVEEGFDLAIRNGELVDSSLVVRRIATSAFATVASEGYLAARGIPQRPQDLDGHACLIYAPQHEPRPWEFQGAAGPILHHPQSNFRTADAEQIRAAALANLGLAHGPIWLFLPEIASGAVRVVLADYAPPPIAIIAVHPARRRLPARVRVFIDFLLETLPRELAPS
jgi:LysR family transcriptional regulator for bpeEF and oprC